MDQRSNVGDIAAYLDRYKSGELSLEEFEAATARFDLVAISLQHGLQSALQVLGGVPLFREEFTRDELVRAILTDLAAVSCAFAVESSSPQAVESVKASFEHVGFDEFTKVLGEYTIEEWKSYRQVPPVLLDAVVAAARIEAVALQAGIAYAMVALQLAYAVVFQDRVIDPTESVALREYKQTLVRCLAGQEGRVEQIEQLVAHWPIADLSVPANPTQDARPVLERERTLRESGLGIAEGNTAPLHDSSEDDAEPLTWWQTAGLGYVAWRLLSRLKNKD